MAFCVNCGNKLEDGFKFCPICGTPTDGNAQPSTQVKKKKFWKGILIATFAVLAILIGSYFVTDVFFPENHYEFFGWVYPNNSPKDIAVKSLEYVKKGDYAGFFNYVKQDDETDERYLYAIGLYNTYMERVGGLSSYIIEGEFIEGHHATVLARVTFGNGTTKSIESLYENEYGKWVTMRPFDVLGLEN